MAGAAPDLVLATWNIHAGVGTDGRFGLERIAAEVARLDADVVALQEVDAYQGRSRGINMWRELGLRTGMAAFFGPNLLGPDPEAAAPDGHPGRWVPQYGNAVLTRLPVVAVENHLLSRPGGPAMEPRGCLEVDFGTWALLATHWGLDGAERQAQSRDLCTLVRRSDAAGRPAVVLGDLNAVRVSPEVERLRALRLDAGAGAGPTFPADGPTRRIDYAFLPPTWQAVQARVLATPASDHHPLVVTARPGALAGAPAASTAPVQP